MRPHPRLSVNSLSSLFQTLEQDIAMWADMGIEHVGLITPKLEAAGWDHAENLINKAGLRVSNISAEVHALTEALHLAGSVGAGTVYICSGPGGSRSWKESAADFKRTMAPLVALASRLGVKLAVEPTNPLRTDLSFVFTLRDAADLAADAGVAVVVDLYSCWYERGFEERVAKNIDAIALVQVCDYAFGTFNTPNRAVPGDGDIPLPRMLSALAAAGYGGAYDLEVLGPRIEEEGYPSAVLRSVEKMTELLTEAGVPA